MDGIRACFFDGSQDFIHDQIGLVHRRRTQIHGFISHLDVERVFIRIGINRYRFNAHGLGCLNHPASNLATIGNQYFFDFFSRHEGLSSRLILKRQIRVLLPRVLKLFVLEHRKRTVDPSACGMGLDDLVDIAAFGCSERGEKHLFIFTGFLGDDIRLI